MIVRLCTQVFLLQDVRCVLRIFPTRRVLEIVNVAIGFDAISMVHFFGSVLFRSSIAVNLLYESMEEHVTATIRIFVGCKSDFRIAI